MPRPQTYAFVILALASAGLGWLAYEQHNELVRLRAAGMSNEERESWQKKVWALEKAKSARASGSAAAQGENRAEEEEQNREDRAERGRDRRGPGGFQAIATLMNTPEFMKLLSTQQKGAIEARYAALFRNLNLTPAEREKLKGLLAERQNAVLDVFSAAREQGLSGREAGEQIGKMIASAQAEVDSTIKGVLGDQRFDQYKTYESTLSQRSTVNQLAERLSYTQAPLSSQQTEQLISILASEGTQYAGMPGDFGGGPGGMRGAIGGLAMMGGGQVAAPPAQISATAIQQAQGVLSQPQIEALQQLQAEQQAQQQMARMLRSSMGGRQQGGNRGNTGTNTGGGGPGS